MAAFLAAAILGPLWGIRELDAASGEEAHLGAAGDQLDTLVRSQLSEETGLRGYLATRAREYLDSDGPPNPDFDDRAAELRRTLAAAGMPDAGPLVDQMRAAHDRWENEVARPLLKDPARADSLARQTFSKVLTDQLRAASEQLRDAIRVNSRRVEGELRFRINTTVGVSAVVVALFAVAAVFLGLTRATALRRLEREQTLVAALQQTLRVGGTRLPRTEVGFAYASATEEASVGGDLLDSWRDSPESGWFLIADVSGKGIQAARHSAFVQYAIRALAAGDDDPSSVVAKFNGLFLDTFTDPSVFVVLFLGRFDARTAVLRYASAGHSAAFVRRGSLVQQLPPTGPIIGMERESTFPTRSVNLRIGETVLLATDGLTESRDKAGVFLGDEGVAKLLASAPLDPQGICDMLVGEAEQRAQGEITDDLAILAISVVATEDGSDTRFSTMEAAPRH